MRAMTHRVRSTGRSNEEPFEGGDPIRSFELLAEHVEERGLLAGLRQEQLGDPQAALDGARDRRGEDQCPGATAQTGRLRVDVRDIAGVVVERRQRDHVLAQQRGSVPGRNLLEAAREGTRGARPRSRWGA
jgi:hypothetical protein